MGYWSFGHSEIITCAVSDHPLVAVLLQLDDELDKSSDDVLLQLDDDDDVLLQLDDELDKSSDDKNDGDGCVYSFRVIFLEGNFRTSLVPVSRFQ